MEKLEQNDTKTFFVTSTVEVIVDLSGVFLLSLRPAALVTKGDLKVNTALCSHALH